MSLCSALRYDLRFISPLRRASLDSFTFPDYALNVRELLKYIESIKISSDNPHQLDVTLSNYEVYFYDLNSKRGNLQKYRYTIYGTIHLLSDIKRLLRYSKKSKKLGQAVTSKSPSLLSVTTVNAISAWMVTQGKSEPPSQSTWVSTNSS